jgi:hypothetical protein
MIGCSVSHTTDIFRPYRGILSIALLEARANWSNSVGLEREPADDVDCEGHFLK